MDNQMAMLTYKFLDMRLCYLSCSVILTQEFSETNSLVSDGWI
jgi:hypothetical protein